MPALPAYCVKHCTVQKQNENIVQNLSPVLITQRTSHLGFRVRSKPRKDLAPPALSQSSVEAMRKIDSQRHAVFGFVCRVAEHQALISGANILLITFLVHPLSDVGGLLLNSNKNVASFKIKAFVWAVVSNVSDNVTRDLGVVNGCSGCDFATNQNKTGLGEAFCLEKDENYGFSKSETLLMIDVIRKNRFCFCSRE